MCSQFVSNVQGNQERATNIILNNELLLLKYVSSNTVTELRSSPPPLFVQLFHFCGAKLSVVTDTAGSSSVVSWIRHTVVCTLTFDLRFLLWSSPPRTPEQGVKIFVKIW